MLGLDTSDLHHIIFKQCAPDLHKSLNSDFILPHLLSRDLISQSEHEKLILPSLTPSDRISFIVTTLPRKGSDWWKIFIDCLNKSTAHGELAKKLKAGVTDHSGNEHAICANLLLV